MSSVKVMLEVVPDGWIRGVKEPGDTDPVFSEYDCLDLIARGLVRSQQMYEIQVQASLNEPISHDSYVLSSWDYIVSNAACERQFAKKKDSYEKSYGFLYTTSFKDMLQQRATWSKRCKYMLERLGLLSKRTASLMCWHRPKHNASSVTPVMTVPELQTLLQTIDALADKRIVNLHNRHLDVNEFAGTRAFNVADESARSTAKKTLSDFISGCRHMLHEVDVYSESPTVGTKRKYEQVEKNKVATCDGLWINASPATPTTTAEDKRARLEYTRVQSDLAAIDRDSFAARGLVA